MHDKPTLEQSFASNAQAVNWSDRNGNIKPEDVFKSSKTKYWFKCDKCNHHFNTALYSITDGNRCPYCSNKKLCDDEDCNLCFEKSFADNDKAKYWCKSNKLLPHQVFKSSGKKFNFNCICGHNFNSILSNITNLNRWCIYCANQKLCKNKNCKICFEKSFASNDKAKYWSKDNTKTPREVFKSSHVKYKFSCICGHEFESQLNSVVKKHWCPYCANQKLCKNKLCKQCFDKSFAKNSLCKFWDFEKNILEPHCYFISCKDLCWFICENKHKFKTSLNSISSSKSWCPLCKNKTEAKLHDWLKSQYEVTYQPKYEWCKKKQKLPYDFAIEEFKILIELDGDQHFQDFDHWDSDYKEVQANDKFKMLKALQNGYSIIRIYQPDVLNDTIDWKTIIQELITLKDEWCIMYVSSNDIYDDEECDFNFNLAKNDITELEVDEIIDKIDDFHLEEEVGINESSSQEDSLEEDNDTKTIKIEDFKNKIENIKSILIKEEKNYICYFKGRVSL